MRWRSGHGAPCRGSPLLAARVDALAAHLRRAAAARVAQSDARLRQAAGGLAQLDPRAVLARGYAIALDAGGRAVRDSAALEAGDRLEISFARGRAGVRVEDKS
ncbi:MAG: hypothetical protein M5U08_07785 [Burkholderiales bacterium]|nr:hypothetical protein [Burkholderiales bacterium]